MIQARNKSHFQGKEPFLEELLRQIRFLAVRSHAKQGFTVLDLGCGFDGAFLKSISSKISTGVGYDLDITKKKISKNICLTSKKINEKLILPKNHFDLITSLAVFEHLGKSQEVLIESYKSLKDGAKLVITTPPPWSRYILEFLAFGLKLISKTEISDHKHYYSKKEIKKMLRKAGFKNKNIAVSYFLFGFNTIVVAVK